MRVLMYTLAWLPLPLLQGIGTLTAWLMCVTNASRWRVALFNLQHCMPELDAAERKRIAKASLRLVASSCGT